MDVCDAVAIEIWTDQLENQQKNNVFFGLKNDRFISIKFPSLNIHQLQHLESIIFA